MRISQYAAFTSVDDQPAGEDDTGAAMLEMNFPARAPISAAMIGILLSAAPAFAGCNSGNVANSSLLSNSACQANGSGDFATAVGSGAAASNTYATALGFFSAATEFQSTALGTFASATGSGSSAFGYGASARGNQATVVGSNAEIGSGAAIEGITVIGSNAGSYYLGGDTGTYAIALGANTHSFGNNSIAIGGANSSGQAALSRGLQSIAIGLASGSNDLNAIAVGVGAAATSVNAIAIGPGTQSANSAVALGPNTTATGASSVAIGAGTESSGGTGAVALGNAANSSGDEAVAIGNGSRSNNSGSTALGAESAAINSGAIAVGLSASASGSNAVALGASSGSLATNTIAIGALSTVTKNNSIALGSHARVTVPNAVAIGTSSIANAPQTVSVGRAGSERRITNVANAVQSTDAVNLGQVQSLILFSSRPSSVASGNNGAHRLGAATPASLITTNVNGGAQSPKNEKVQSHSDTSSAISSGCSKGDMSGNWSLIATNIEEVGAGSALWCEMAFGDADADGNYSVTGHCVGNAPRDLTEQHFDIEGNQSVGLTPSCQITGALTLRQGATTINVSILHGRIESTGEMKSRAMAVSRWSRGNKFTLQTLVMQR